MTRRDPHHSAEWGAATGLLLALLFLLLSQCIALVRALLDLLP